MTTKPVETQFAPAERASVKAVFEQSRCFSNSSLLRQLFDASPTLLMGLNEHRQIVFANQSMFNWLGPEHNEDTAYGLRPGEALDCAHAFESEGGCGTTQFCRTCGAVQAILAGLHGREAVKECRITQRNGNALDLRVWATPLELNGNLLPGSKPFIAFAVSDISHEKRRRALERIFFHDILNTASGLQGVSELLKEAGPDELDELKEIVAELAGTLIGEINAQKLLSEAESGELAVNLAPVNAVTLLQEVITLYKNHHVAKDRTLRLAPESETAVLHTDKTLLKRVIGNMTKNALEAAEPGQTVTLGCTVNRSAVQFWVHNPTFMPPNVQLQVFQRSFSTRGTGRGLGTYSIKLLTERYLKGRVSFITSPEEGTTFFACYPLSVAPVERKAPLLQRLAAAGGNGNSHLL